ncbi:hypothetical protein HYH03_000462 [Edaphochlamys debaryana]|uniref:BTB domain-containing protein n=1 Tax=Edaphochlamys debaryana TaxID=47281 RepID=A0A835YP09_9CHLO|nr:hypothetical protein HYH03_000462 [Edaphochlamys debaryana]|eukprot:KAG2501965.1 hypothetical protein HYH03_000462 [Edaphochlamys debaryana]
MARTKASTAGNFTWAPPQSARAPLASDPNPLWVPTFLAAPATAETTIYRCRTRTLDVSATGVVVRSVSGKQAQPLLFLQGGVVRELTVDPFTGLVGLCAPLQIRSGLVAGWQPVFDAATQSVCFSAITFPFAGIYKLSAANDVSLLAGAPTAGEAPSCIVRFVNVTSLATDGAGGLFLIDSGHIRRLDTCSGAVSAVPGSEPTCGAWQRLAHDPASGRLLAATRTALCRVGGGAAGGAGCDAGGWGGGGGGVEVLAGHWGVAESVDGPGAAARFSSISAVLPVPGRGVLVADGMDLRCVGPAGAVTTLLRGCFPRGGVVQMAVLPGGDLVVIARDGQELVVVSGGGGFAGSASGSASASGSGSSADGGGGSSSTAAPDALPVHPAQSRTERLMGLLAAPAVECEVSGGGGSRVDGSSGGGPGGGSGGDHHAVDGDGDCPDGGSARTSSSGGGSDGGDGSSDSSGRPSASGGADGVASNTSVGGGSSSAGGGNGINGASLCAAAGVVTVRVGDRAFPAHRSILAAGSDYFARLLAPGGSFADSAAAEVALPDADPAAFVHLLSYMYCSSFGEPCTQVLQPPSELLRPTAALAGRLLMGGAVAALTSQLLAAARPDRVLEDLVWADAHGMVELRSRLLNFALTSRRSAALGGVEELVQACPQLAAELMRGLFRV